MSIMRRQRVRSAATITLGVVVGVVLACHKVGAQRDPYNPVPVDRAVTITIDGTQIKAEPMIALMRAGGAIEWTVKGLGQGQTVEIDFKVEQGRKGPFPRPERGFQGRYAVSPEKPTSSGRYEEKAPYAVWKYEIVVRQDGKDVAAIDPIIVGKGDE